MFYKLNLMLSRISFWIIDKISSFLYFLSTRLLRYCHPEWNPRRWSNAELRRWGNLFEGDIINVSGWDDRDKEGGCYSNYFSNKKSYTISNIEGAQGLTGAVNEIYFDLTWDLPKNLHKNYDVVFNFTVLEHVYDINKAFHNLCMLSKDIVILVVPFSQPVHWEPNSYFDYWRLTPFCLEKLFADNGFEIVYFAHNDNPAHNVYLFCIASCQPDKWKRILPKTLEITQINAPGNSRYQYARPKWLPKTLIDKMRN